MPSPIGKSRTRREGEANPRGKAGSGRSGGDRQGRKGEDFSGSSNVFFSKIFLFFPSLGLTSLAFTINFHRNSLL